MRCMYYLFIGPLEFHKGTNVVKKVEVVRQDN